MTLISKVELYKYLIMGRRHSLVTFCELLLLYVKDEMDCINTGLPKAENNV